MKGIYILIGLIIVIGFTNCKKVDELTQFEIEYEQGFTFRSSSPISAPFNIATPPQETNSSAEFAEENTRKDKIEEIKLTKMFIEILDPPSKSLRFLDEIEVFIKAPGLSEVSLADRFSIPNSIGNYLELDVSNENFEEYIKEDSFTIRLRTVYDEQVLEDLEARCVMTFFIDAKVL